MKMETFSKEFGVTTREMAKGFIPIKLESKFKGSGEMINWKDWFILSSDLMRSSKDPSKMA